MIISEKQMLRIMFYFNDMLRLLYDVDNMEPHGKAKDCLDLFCEIIEQQSEELKDIK